MKASAKTSMALALVLTAAFIPFIIIGSSLRLASTNPPDEWRDYSTEKKQKKASGIVENEKPAHLRFQKQDWAHDEASPTANRYIPHDIERSVLVENNHERVTMAEDTSVLNRAFQWLLGNSESDSTSLQTPFDGTESGNGIMFEVEATSGVIVTSMDLNVETTSSRMISVYNLAGSFQGKENDRGVWKRVFSASVTGAGRGQLTKLDPSEFSAVKIYPESSSSFYVVMESHDLLYTVEKELNAVVAKNSQLLVRVGKAIDLAFGNVLGNRAFNGVIYYNASKSNENDQVFADGLASPIGQPLQLTTPLDAGNYAYGIMFDVIILNDMQIMSLDINIPEGSTVFVNVYTLTGTHRNNEIDPNAWILVFSASVTGLGKGVASPLPADKFKKLALRAGSRQAFYITASEAVLQYTNGSRINRVFIENHDMKILEGTSVARPFFGGVFAPRRFNGAIHYQLVGDPAASMGREFGGMTAADAVSEAMGQLSVLQLKMSGSSGSYGVMFDIMVDNQIVVSGIDIHTSVVDKTFSAKVFTKEGSHKGFELDVGDGIRSSWKIVGESELTGYGQGRFTPLPDFQDPINIGPGKTQAFFVILKTSELRYDTPDPALEGEEIDAYDQNLKVMRGTGVGEGAQRFPSRVVNGAIRYYPVIGLLA